MVFMIFVFFLLGSVVGTLSGLLGIGGGIVVVPALVYIFHYEHFPEHTVMHLAVGTSLAVMMFTTYRSLRLHLARKGRREFWVVSKVLMPSVIVGVIGGAVLADFMHSSVLKIIFGVFILIIATRLLIYRPKGGEEQVPPSKLVNRIAGVVIGALSGLLGVGGGTTVIPYLLYFNQSMRLAVRVAIFVGFLVAIVGSISYFFSGLNETLPAHCLGFIYWPAWIGISVGSVLFAPLGVRLSYHTPTAVLQRIFAVLMLVIGIHMLLF